MRHGSLFSGGGGFDIAAEWMGWENIFHCEVNPFAKTILKYWWPAAISYDDITKTDFSIHRGSIDILTGGFPCQPFSNAGQQKGTADPRYLWPEMLRVIREIRPRWIVGENVYGLVNWSGGLVFDTIKSDLENEGYEVIPVVLPAAGVNAPHNRARIWFIAKDTNEDGWRSEQRDTGAGDNERVRADNGEVRATTDTASKLLTRHESRECGDQRWKDVQQDYREDDTKLTKPNGKDGDATNTQNIRHQRTGQTWNGGQGLADDNFGNDVADTGDKGLQGREFNGTFNQEGQERRQQPSGSIAELHQIGPWDHFPTQSPVCSRDDGFSPRLDGITFSKWRSESIKLYGNAVVPELVMQIFKTIELYEHRADNQE